ncbi:MAG: T9SS type A sorting domain-containing protein [Bacteriodetes bacterium]|nr:T9SS type A sorting domain-containing protein [Bacteroidota bacterium]
MKSSVLAFVLLFVAVSDTSFAQLYKQMMNDPNVNFYDVVKEAEQYFENRDKGKGTGYAPYQRWKHENESRYYPTGVRNTVSPYFTQEQYAGFVQQNAPMFSPQQPQVFDNGWHDLGPYRVDKITGHYAPGLGRVETFYVNPKDTNRLYLGSRSGGFWRSTDGGKTWKGTTDFLVASGVNAIAVSPTNPDSILINVRNANNGVTHGVYRSVDGGLTWKVTPFNPTNLGKGGLGSNFSINKIAYSPYVSNLIFVTASDGIYRSTDNLATWTKVTNGSVSEIEFHPTNANYIYIYDYNSNRNVVLRSTNQGQTFTASNTVPNNNNNTSVRLSVSKACPNCVYFASSNGVWKSTDYGMNFTFIAKPNPSNGAFTVNDIDDSKMIIGDIDLWVSTNGGQTYTQKTWWSLGSTPFNGPSYIHADLRNARCVNGVFYVATDGYLCKSTDNGNTWSRLSEGTGIRENYVVGVGQSNSYRSICGSQDNGQSLLTENGWLEIYGADGMEGFIHPLNDDWLIGSWQNGGRRRSKDGGITGQGVTPPNQKNASWVAPLLNDPNNQMRVYSISDSVYRSDNFGSTWQNLGYTTIGTAGKAAIAENNSNIIFISSGSKLVKSTDGGKTFSAITGLPNYSITDIAFNPRNDYNLIVTYNRYQRDSSKVYMSTNLGASWTNITYNLNDMPVNTVVIDHQADANIYLGTELGVFTKKMSEKNWKLYNTNLPNMAVLDLKVQYGTNSLRAATWGRGLWEYTLAGRNTYPSIPRVKISTPPTDATPRQTVPQFVTANVVYPKTLSKVFVKWSVSTPTFTNTIAMTKVNDTTYQSETALPDQPVGTNVYFKVYAVGVDNDTTETYKYQYTVYSYKYCDAIGSSNTTADYINSVELNGVKKTSAKESYADFTKTIIELFTDTEYTLKVGMNYHWEQDTTAAWIDYNHNALFDADEIITMSTIDSLHNSVGKFRVPNDVAADTTRMRVRSQYFNETPNPCGDRTGEVEDYTIVFKQAPRLAHVLSNTTLCNTGGVRFTYTGDKVDSLSWALTSAGFVYTSKSSDDSLALTKPGVYRLQVTGYKYGRAFTSTTDTAITFIIVDTSITQGKNILTATATNATYQWLDCADNYRPVPGATSKSFTPQSNGLYAVQITQGDCADTSMCYAVQLVGVQESDAITTPTLSPNPTTGTFDITLHTDATTGTINVFDIRGHRITSTTYTQQPKVRIDISDTANGLYIIEVRTATQRYYFKVTKQD